MILFLHRLDMKCKVKGSFPHGFQQTSDQTLTVQRDTGKTSYSVMLRHQKYFLSSWTALITHHSHKLASAVATAVIHSYNLLPRLLVPDKNNLEHFVRDHL